MDACPIEQILKPTLISSNMAMVAEILFHYVCACAVSKVKGRFCIWSNICPNPSILVIPRPKLWAVSQMGFFPSLNSWLSYQPVQLRVNFLANTTSSLLPNKLVFSWEPALWLANSQERALSKKFCKKKALMSKKKHWVLSLDMKTKVARHVPRIAFQN